MKMRINLDMSQIIENGLVVDDIQGSLAAWEYLLAHDIPSPIVLRVLSSPARRRESDPHGEPKTLPFPT